MREGQDAKGGDCPEYRIYFKDRGWHWQRRETLDEDKENVALILASLMRDVSQRHQKDPCLDETVRKFLRTLKPLRDPTYFQCVRQHFLAMRFDLPVEIFLDYPEFADFLESNHLYHLLQHHGHEIAVIDGEPQIKYNGDWVGWTWVRDSHVFPMGEGYQLLEHCYSYCGLTEGTKSDWTSWQPFRWENPASWDYQYVMEICCNCTDRPENITGDHSWFRLKDPNGWVRSVGLYRDGKNTADKVGVACVAIPRDHLDDGQSVSIKRAYLYSPDISEYHPQPYFTWQFAITKETFDQIKESVEEDKANGVFIQMLRHNCTRYVKAKAQMAGVDIPTEIAAARVLFAQIPGLVPLVDSVSTYVPEVGRRTAETVLDYFINMIQYSLGGTQVHRNVEDTTHAPDPVMGSFWDIFRHPETAKMHHPWFMNAAGQVVEKYREQSGDRWGIPPEMQLDHYQHPGPPPVSPPEDSLRLWSRL